MSGIKKQAAWLFFGNIFAAVLQVIQLSVLSRHLELHELGLVAIVNTILSVAMILQDMGMSSFIIHKQNISIREQSTIYWVNVALGIVATGVVILLSIPISFFYNSAELKWLIILASLNFLILGSLSQYQAHFIKNKKMVSLAKIEMFARFVSFLSVMGLIFYFDLRASAVILGLIVNAFLRVFLMFLFGDKSWRPTFQFQGSICKDAFNYGIFQLGSQVINQLRTQIDVLIVGRVLGTESLGLYSLAKDLIMQPLKLITPVINRLALPRFAEKQHDAKILQSLFLKGSFYILTVSSVIYISILLLSPVIVRVLYGAGREQVAYLLPFMLIFGILRPMGGLTGAIAQANGKTNLEFYWNIVAGAVILVFSFTMIVFSQLWYVSFVLSLSQIVITLMVYPFFIKPVVGVSFYRYLSVWLIPLICIATVILLVTIYDIRLYPLSLWFIRG